MKLEKLLGALLLCFVSGCAIYTGFGDYALEETKRLNLSVVYQEAGLNVFIAVRLSLFGLFMALVSIFLIIAILSRLEKVDLSRQTDVKSGLN